MPEGDRAAVNIDPLVVRSYVKTMRTVDVIKTKLTAAFAPQNLDVVDESHKHEGHAGHRPGGQTHYRVHIVSNAFKGKTRIERHRMINETLAGELSGGVPSEPEAPDIERKLAGDQKPRGWGLFLIKNMVDDVRISSDGSHHTVELVMRLEGGVDEHH